MQFGICTSLASAPQAKQAGWDYIEESAQGLLQGMIGDADWTAPQRTKGLALPILAANCLVPAELKICGPQCDPSKVRTYMNKVIERAGKLGLKTLVAGSAGARNVPDGFDRETAKRQIIHFLKSCVEPASRQGIVVVVEPLCRKESNIINSFEEAMVYVRAVDHAAVRCLVDSFHFWAENEPLTNIRQAGPWISHVHVANHRSRKAPEGPDGESDYRAFLGALKRCGYDKRISVETPAFEYDAAKGKRVLQFLREQWGQA